MKIPNCCGEKMNIILEDRHLIELGCEKCGDVLFLKREKIPKPQMLDD